MPERVGAVNGAVARYDQLRPLHVMFRDAAAAHPQDPAIVAGPVTVDYGQLSRSVDALTRWLLARSAGPGERIGVCMERSTELVVTLLAALSTGAAFVPLDPRWPIARIRAVVRAATPRVVLLDRERSSLTAQVDGAYTFPDALDTEAEAPVRVPETPPNAPAYIYFTSGSTGEPKGVVTDHRGAAGRVRSLLLRFPLGTGDRVAFKTPLSFDVAIWDVFGPLSAGATVEVVRPHGESDVERLQSVLTGPRLVSAHFVPSMLAAYLQHASPAAYPGLRWVWTSGEAVSAALLERFDRHFPPRVEFHNLYGQTETSEVAAWTGRRVHGDLVPLGRQMGEYRLFPLDDELNLAPPGVTGELWVAGLGALAHGYLGRPDLTAERFVPHPYPLEPGELIYRTGDLACAGPDGTLSFRGRRDRQVKVRGGRTELDEVEAVIARHPAVGNCAVVLRSDGSGAAELVAYLVGGTVALAEIRALVTAQLPSHMVPTAYVRLDALPLLPSGKLDRAALPAPDQHARATEPDAAGLQTPLQFLLASFWRRVLGVANVGPGEDFFASGGTSLKAVTYLHLVRTATGVRVSHEDFFAVPTLAGLERRIQQAGVRHGLAAAGEPRER